MISKLASCASILGAILTLLCGNSHADAFASTTEQILRSQREIQQKLDLVAPLPALNLGVDLEQRLLRLIDHRAALVETNGKKFHVGYERASSVRAKLLVFRELFLSTYRKLRNDNHLYALTDEVLTALNLRQYLCNPTYRCGAETGCKRLKALYVPLVDRIYIRPDLEGTALDQAVLHEVLHAYQYRYRFASDLKTLVELATADQAVLKPGQVLNYLSLLYESEANWYELQAAQPAVWMDQTWKLPIGIRQAERLGHAMISSLWHYARLFVPGETATHPGLVSLNELLPEVDQFNPHEVMVTVYDGKEPSALYFNELVFYKYPAVIHLVGNLDLGFHKKFADAIDCAYYGHLDFLFEKATENQRVTRAAHDAFYGKILDYSLTYHECQAHLEALYEKHGSPLLAWLLGNPDELNRACDSFAGQITPALQQSIISLYFHTSASPFQAHPAGVEGGSGDLGLLDSIQVLPQIDVLPLPEPEPDRSQMEAP